MRVLIYIPDVLGRVLDKSERVPCPAEPLAKLARPFILCMPSGIGKNNTRGFTSSRRRSRR